MSSYASLAVRPILTALLVMVYQSFALSARLADKVSWPTLRLGDNSQITSQTTSQAEGLLCASRSRLKVEEEAAAIYLEYQKNLQSGQRRKPVVGFVAGQQAMRGREYGHSGAIWWDENEQAGSKIALWRESGITVAEHIGQVGGLIQREMEALRHLRQ